MESSITKALALRYNPVVVLLCDERPEEAQEFKAGKWGCVMWLFAATAATGKTAAFSQETYGCWGGGVGLGFGNQYTRFPAGMDGFCRFLSAGNENWQRGVDTAKQLEPLVSREFLDDYLKGEGYIKTPELVEDFVNHLPIIQVPARYVVFKPLAAVALQKERPQVIVLLADPNQLSALVILANYGRRGIENVIIPYAAGCQTIGILPFREAASPTPRAVVGLTDISARLNIRKQLGGEFFTFSIPWQMFLEMEADVKGSFLEKRTWRALLRKS